MWMERRMVKKDNKINPIIIGIGASAGGLEAIETLLKHTIPIKNTSYVIIQHLNPKHKSIMQDIIQKYTTLQVKEISKNTSIQPNYIYLKPPDKDIIIKNNTIQVEDPITFKGLNLPIDRFFKSLASNKKHQAIGVILSGTGTDGSVGIKEIKGENGIIIVQDPNQAEHAGMPESAILTNMVDYTLPVEKIGKKINEIINNPHLHTSLTDEEIDQHFIQIHLIKILNIVREKTGHDFTEYKETTIIRRIQRRIALHQIQDISAYLTYLQNNEQEVHLLFKDLTIKVTSFFRNPEAFETLKEKAIRPMVKRKPDKSTIRIWIAGCDTGEEAYTIAILFSEVIEELHKQITLQIFASDIDQQAIETARQGIYPQNIITNVSKQRLEKYFNHQGTTYQVKKNIREMIVFAEQNIIKDPPFSKLDLISCRNLLIYLNNNLQKKLIPLFHYILNSKGILFIGLSESIGEFTDQFTTIHSKYRIYQRNDAYIPAYFNNQQLHPQHPRLQTNTVEKPLIKKMDISYIVDKILLDRFAPATALIDQHFEILYFSGNTNKYLANPRGHRSFNVLEMARWGLKTKIRVGVEEAQTSQKTIIYENCQVKQNGEYTHVNLTIEPVTGYHNMNGLTLLVFEEVQTYQTSISSEDSQTTDFDRKQLEQELHTTRADLQATIEELETSNEELQSVNEELQSTNEELETSREELQATNEELSTVNIELQKKVDELSIAKDDANNLLENTDIATIFLDTNLNIQRFTPHVKKLFNIREIDIDRPITDITTKIQYTKLYNDAKKVLDTLVRKEIKVSDVLGRQFSIRICPYRTMDNRIKGIVLTFIDITDVTNAKIYAEGIVESLNQPLLILKSNLMVHSANKAFYDTFKVSKKETMGSLIYDLGNGQWNIPSLKKLLEDIIPKKTSIEEYLVEHEFAQIGFRRMKLNAREIQFKGNHEPYILIAIEDISTLDGGKV